MTWFKVDDRFHAHPKVLALRSGAHEETAIALWLKAGSWCASNLTDGAVPSYVLDSLVRRNGPKAAAELVRVGLWETTDDGFRFRSWSEYQPSKSDVESKREKTARKVADWRDKKRASDPACNQVTRADVTAPVTLPPARPDPTRPSPGGDVPRETLPPSSFAPVDRMLASLTPVDAAERETIRVISETRVAAGGAPWVAMGHHDREAALRLSRWASDPSIGFGRLGEALASFWAVKGTAARLSWMTDEDPGRWLGKVAPKTRQHRPAKPNDAYATDTTDLDRALGVTNG